MAELTQQQRDAMRDLANKHGGDYRFDISLSAAILRVLVSIDERLATSRTKKKRNPPNG